MQPIKFILYSYFLLILVTIYSAKVFAATPSFLPAADTGSFVSLADIHFNPFYTCNKENKNCPNYP